VFQPAHGKYNELPAPAQFGKLRATDDGAIVPDQAHKKSRAGDMHRSIGERPARRIFGQPLPMRPTTNHRRAATGYIMFRPGAT